MATASSTKTVRKPKATTKKTAAKKKAAPGTAVKNKTPKKKAPSTNAVTRDNGEYMFVYSIRISNGLFAKVERKAKSAKLPVSQVIRDAIEAHVGRTAASNGGVKAKSATKKTVRKAPVKK